MKQSRLTPTDVTEAFRSHFGRPITVHAVRVWLRAGTLPAVKVGGRFYISPADLKKFFARRGKYN